MTVTSERRIVRALRGLMARGARLSPRGDGRFDIDAGTARDDVADSLDGATVRALVQREFVAACGGNDLVITARGRAYLKGATQKAPRRPIEAASTALSNGQASHDGPAAAGLDVSAIDGTVAWLRARRGKDGAPLISDAECLAAQRLRVDYFRAFETPTVTAAYEPHASGSADGRGVRAENALVARMDRMIAAQERLQRALTSLGPELAGVAVDVCCRDCGLTELERRHGWPQRSGRMIVSLALRHLARHYGFASGPPLQLDAYR